MPFLSIHYYKLIQPIKVFFSLVFHIILVLLREFWWLLLFLFCLKILLNLSQSYKKKVEKKKKEIKDWVVLEIKVNREILQTPKAMEQVFAGLHSMKKGKISLEILSSKKEINFIVRLPKEYRKLLESQLYAQYPEIDITEIYDYFSFFPPFLPNKDFNLFGSEIIFTKADCYPIKTYPLFEEPKEEKRIDPLANLIEAASQLQASEYLLLQIIIEPLNSEKSKKWVETGRKEINKLLGIKEPKTITWHDWVHAFIKNLLLGLFTAPVWPESKKEEKGTTSLSPGDREKIEKIEAKIAKLGFETSIRFLYFGPKEIYDETSSLAIPAYFKQFSTENLNAFKINEEATTEVKTNLFKNRRTILKKINFYQACKNRAPAQKTIVLNTEELASIYHFPVLKVKAPALVRSLSRKGEAPSNLPI